MKKMALLATAALVLLSSCLSVSYLVESDPGGDFTKYQTYQVEEHCLDFKIGVNELNKQRIENALFLDLRDRGMNPSDHGDLIVKYFVRNELKQFTEGCEEYYDQWEGGTYCVERIRTYTEGTLIVDIIDQSANKVIWHGAAMGPVYDKMKNPNDKIRKIVNELLDDFDRRLKAV